MNKNLMVGTEQQPAWYILGAGAIGCLWASYWRQAGYRVVLITPTARSQHILTLQANNKQIQTTIEQITLAQLQASDLRIDHLLVTTKAQHTVAAVSAIKSHLVKQATVLVLQNGMAVTKLPALLPEQQLIAATTTDGAYRSETMTVVHAGIGQTFFGYASFGAAIAKQTNNYLETLLTQLPTAYLNIKPCNNIEWRLWQKLAINCAVNGLTAIYHCRNGELLNIPEAMRRINTLCDEIIAIATALNVTDAVQQLHNRVIETLQKTANNYSSMHQDIANGRSTEIDYLNGYLCELAHQKHIGCAENQRVVDAIKQLEGISQG